MLFIFLTIRIGILIYGILTWDLFPFYKRFSLSIIKTRLERSLMLCVSLVVISVFFYTLYYIGKEKNFIYFIVFLILFVLSIIVLIISNRSFLLFVAWDGLGITSFFLVAFYQNWKSLNRSLITFFSNRVGDGVLLVLLTRFIFTTNKIRLSLTFVLISLLVVLIRITKSAQFPFSSWLPAAIAAPTPISSLVHRRTLVTAGVLVLIKFNSLLELWWVKRTLLYLSIITIVVAGITAIREKDLKKVVAFSTLSQIGLLFFIIRFNLVWLCCFHLIMHAFFKSLLFFSVGRLLHFRSSLQDSRYISNSILFRKFSLVLTQITLLSLIGILFLSGYYSKDIFLEIVLNKKGRVFYLIIIFIIFTLTFLYRRKIIITIFNRTFLNSLNKRERSQQFVFSSICLSMLVFFSGKIFFINFFIIYERFIFREKLFLFLFLSLLVLFSYFPLLKGKIRTEFFYINYLTSLVGKRFYLKCSTIIERGSLEGLNIIFYSRLKEMRNYLFLTVYSTKTLILVFILLLFILII